MNWKRRLVVCLALAETASSTEEYLMWTSMVEDARPHVPEQIDMDHPDVRALVEVYRREA